MPYTAEVSRYNPACFLFLIDQSGSMKDSMPGDASNNKAQFVALAINRILQELVIRCSKDMEIYRYFQVGVIGYGPRVGPVLPGELLDQPLVWIDELYHNPLRVDTITKKVSDGAGGLIELDIKFPVWFEPVSQNGTPMVQALQQAHSILRDWINEHPSSFPPIIINITDGESTDGDPRPVAELIKQLATSDGNVLLLNLHVSSKTMSPLTFPDTSNATFDSYAHALFGMSSLLPEQMLDAAIHNGYQVSAKSRGFVYNAGIEDVIQFLDIGTRASQVSTDGQELR